MATQTLNRPDQASHGSDEVRDLLIGLLLIAVSLAIAATPFLIIALADLRIAVGFVFGALAMAGYSFIERSFMSRDTPGSSGSSHTDSSPRSSEPSEQSQVSGTVEMSSIAYVSAASTDPSSRAESSQR